MPQAWSRRCSQRKRIPPLFSFETEDWLTSGGFPSGSGGMEVCKTLQCTEILGIVAKSARFWSWTAAISCASIHHRRAGSQYNRSLHTPVLCLCMQLPCVCVRISRDVLEVPNPESFLPLRLLVVQLASFVAGGAAVPAGDPMLPFPPLFLLLHCC